MGIGSRLAEERRRLGLTQEQLGAHLAVGRSAIAMLETERSGIDAQRLVDLTTSAGIDLVYVMTGTTTRKLRSDPVDWKLVEIILRQVSQWCKAQRVTLAPEKQALVLKVLYEHFVQSGTVDAQRLSEVMRLAA